METSELVDRYVFAVSQHLPAKQRKDISDELRSSLWDALEARYGTPTNLEQAAKLLKEFGPPEKVAASYWAETQYLIGPGLYQIYRTVLNILVIVWLVAGVISIVISSVVGGQLKPLEWLADLIQGFVSMFGGVTLVFAILQRVGVKDADEKSAFDPMKLPRVEQEDLVSRPGQFAAVTFGVIFLVLFAYIPTRLETLFPQAIVIRSPAVEASMGWIIMTVFLGVLIDLFLLVRGRWSVWTRLAKIGTNIFGMAVFGIILNSPLGLVEVGELGAEVTQPGQMGLTIALSLVIAILAIDTVGILYGILKRYVFSPLAAR